MKTKKKYWYMFYVGCCPVCGKDKSFKERRYEKKPDNKKEQYVELSDHQTYDGCNR